MKDVCQDTGKDLNPASHAHLEVRNLLCKVLKGDYDDGPYKMYILGFQGSKFINALLVNLPVSKFV